MNKRRSCARLPLVASVLGRKYGVTVTIGRVARLHGRPRHPAAGPCLWTPQRVPSSGAQGLSTMRSRRILRETDFAAVSEAKLKPLEKHVCGTFSRTGASEKSLAARFPRCPGAAGWQWSTSSERTWRRSGRTRPRACSAGCC